MKIGVVGTIWLNTPPKGYGGTEEVVYNLVNGLVDKGHDVTLFGPKTAKVKAKLIPTVDLPLREKNVGWENFPYTLYHITEAFDRAGNFDILHVHLNKSQDFMALPLARLSKTPVVFTIHFEIVNSPPREDRILVLEKYRNLPFISISDSQRQGIDLNFIKTVYNSLNIQSFPFNNKPEDYFVWLGKINPVKGTKEAILAAKKGGHKLLVLGAIDKGMPKMLSYYKDEIKPLIDNKNIIWVGEVSVSEKARILGKAKAFLNPILWEEPFGLVMVESQACGTPVISFRRGAATEVIIDGENGFLVDNLSQMIEKMDQTESIKRENCRKNVRERFTIEKMIEGYEEAYKITIENWKEYLAR